MFVHAWFWVEQGSIQRPFVPAAWPITRPTSVFPAPLHSGSCVAIPFGSIHWAGQKVNNLQGPGWYQLSQGHSVTDHSPWGFNAPLPISRWTKSLRVSRGTALAQPVGALLPSTSTHRAIPFLSSCPAFRLLQGRRAPQVFLFQGCPALKPATCWPSWSWDPFLAPTPGLGVLPSQPGKWLWPSRPEVSVSTLMEYLPGSSPRWEWRPGMLSFHTSLSLCVRH